MVVADCLLSQGADIIGFCANEPSNLLGLPYLGHNASLEDSSASLILAIGDNATRKKLSQQMHHRQFASTIHTSAEVSMHALIGIGCMVLHRAIVQARTSVGNHVILNTGCQVDHDGRIGDYVHIGPGAVLCGNVTVGEGSLIGAGATILPGIQVGRWAVVGAGSVVIRNVPDGARVIGSPAKESMHS